MNDDIKKAAETLLNMMSESLSLYKSVKADELQGMAPNVLNSIIQSKENSIALLMKEFTEINPDFKPASYPVTSESIKLLYNKMLPIENKIIEYIQNSFLPNIPSKGHEGIYTIAVNIKNNSESTIVKLNNIMNIRYSSRNSYYDILNSTINLLKNMEVYSREHLTVQLDLCNKILEENKKLISEKYSKKLIIYSPEYGDNFVSICSKFNIKLIDLVKLNGIKNPYSKISSKYLIIVTD